ncbi:MAG: LptA/OstA family protein [Selenomonadaceae bacterium]|nr:LptA/OstA family protein [Selenomonadaceae bacterium]
MNKTARRFSLLLTALSIGAVTVFAAPAPKGPSELIADTVTYDMKNDVMVAKGNVVMITTDGKATGDYAEYHNKTGSGKVIGHVIADKGDAHMECNEFYVEGQSHFTAVGNVKAKQKDRAYVGPKAEFFQDQQYVKMEQGGTVTGKDGSITADFMEGWTGQEHFIGRGNCHIVSPSKNFEGGGDNAEYWGKEEGKTVLTGNAWAMQDDNIMRGKVITALLNQKPAE